MQPATRRCESGGMVLSPAATDLAGHATLLAEHWVGEIKVTHKAYTHNFKQHWHEHEAGSIDFVLEGGGVGTYAGREVVSTPGTVEFFREQLRHRFQSFGSGIRSMHIVIPAAMLRGLPQLRHTLVEELCHTRAVALASRVFAELHQPDASSSLQIESLVHELIDEVAGVASRPDPRAGWLGRARNLLHEHGDEPLTLSELADRVCIDRAHLARTFKQRLGMSVGEYHRRLRLEQAARMIAQSDEPLSRIAQRCGFSDQAHLTRLFRRYTGSTPARYRQALRRR